jgi:hypothetical protein
MTPSERHNKLAAEFVQMAGRNTANGAELMVVVESTMLASLLLLVKAYDTSPSAASAMMEAALHAATERFARNTP